MWPHIPGPPSCYIRTTVTSAKLHPRTALIAPGGWHLRITDEGRTRLSDEAEIGALRPRADLTIEDAARVFGERLLLVVMTGMGNDGLAGAVIQVRQNMVFRPADHLAYAGNVIPADTFDPVAANNLAWVYAQQGDNLDMALSLDKPVDDGVMAKLRALHGGK